MFYNKKITTLYATQHNIQLDSSLFNEDIFFLVANEALNHLLKCLDNKAQLNDKRFNLEYLHFNTKTRNAIHTQLIKYCKKHQVTIHSEEDLMDNSLTKMYLYNNELKKVKSHDDKSIMENIFLYIYCGLFAVKAYHKTDFETQLSYLIKQYNFDETINRLVDKITHLERTSLTLMIISYTN